MTFFSDVFPAHGRRLRYLSFLFGDHKRYEVSAFFSPPKPAKYLKRICHRKEVLRTRQNGLPCLFDIDQFNYIPECHDPLGVESGAISDGQMSASSQWDENLTASQGRLNVKAVPGEGGSWSAKDNNVRQWLQVDLGNPHTKVTALATQGRSDYPQWVTKYKVQYSGDGDNFQHFMEEQPSKITVRWYPP